MSSRIGCSKEVMNRVAWSPLEDQILIDYIKIHGEGKWANINKKTALKRSGKSCRLRWLNYLRPDIKRGNISLEEEDLIIRLHKLLGNRWSLIAGRLPGRTDNEIKNYWNTILSKKARGEHPKQPKDAKMIKKNDIKSSSPAETSGAIKTNTLNLSKIPDTQQPLKVAADAFLHPQSVHDNAKVEEQKSDEIQHAQNLVKEFNVGELLLSDDTSDSEFWKLCDQFENGTEEASHALGLGQYPLFSEEMLTTDWI
ncbi:hypothetical protein SLEP1_g12816 [Rubroshorea leprosula]|uniref:Uncharacterized protein n=1 Tax=Rubroshorea leprosula TaxID=152421 RepID=A0AAV5IDR2_9ROSI|nr:hypothetical protein SLEP1_g12816 [Rubroshorea leprosula]